MYIYMNTHIYIYIYRYIYIWWSPFRAGAHCAVMFLQSSWRPNIYER